ncbi:hypothetical protein ACHWQZ_G019625 [Mnemiopsis leidyi]
MRVLILLCGVLLGTTLASECSSGDTNYMCANLDTCWFELGFASREDLKYLCDVQGIPTGGDGGGGETGFIPRVQITIPPRNVTVPPGASAQFACTAENAVKVIVVPEFEARQQPDVADLSTSPSTQKVIQVIDEAYQNHEGWYICIAYGADGERDEFRAYLRIYDICAYSNCAAPQVCSPDMYTGGFECVCPGNCDNTFDPVCASDCSSYFNECTMRKETCEKGLEGVYVVTRGLCTFTPSEPYFTAYPQEGQYIAGANTLSASASVPMGQSINYFWFYNGQQVGTGADFQTTLTSGHSGQWSVEARSCHGSYNVVHRFTVTVTGGGGLVEPTEQCCKVWGDPHIITFDGKRYDYMGSCDYIIAEDLAGQWLIYGTYKACGDKTKQLSCIVGITVFYQNEMVQFLRMYRINYRGEEFSVPLGSTQYIGEMRIENKAMKYYIYLGNTGVRIMWDGITTSETCLPDRCRSGVQGMCGNADCNPDNEFAGFIGSSAFGNRWAIGQNCDLEPEDGALPVPRTRPCDFIPYETKLTYEARCNLILDMTVFSDCIYSARMDRASMFANCMFDMCSGLTIGGGCDNRGDQRCDAEIEAKITEAVFGGMSRGEAEQLYLPNKVVDPACMMGYGLVNDCSAWNIFINNDWREMARCPSDDELANIVVCP